MTEYVEAAPVGLGAGIGGGWLVGGNGGAYGFGPAQRLTAEARFGTANAVGLRFRHSHHVLRDPDPFFEGVPANGDTLTGGRDDLSGDIGVRLGFDLGRRVYPCTRVGAGITYSRTELDAASFEGRAAIGSSSVSPVLVVDGGAEVRLTRRVSLLPAIAIAWLPTSDFGEVDGKERFGVETRVEPGIDLVVGLP